MNATPFLKWAGGKRQLLAQIDAALPPRLKQGRLRKYAEPFVGSGALFFHVVQRYPIIEIYLADINPELMLVYRTLQRDVTAVIAHLADLEAAYLLCSPAQRRAFYYAQRDQFNANLAAIDFDAFSAAWVQRTAQFIFLNRTGYNGLFRVNSRGRFNVPFGRYLNPTICNAANLRAAAALLQGVRLAAGKFTRCADFVDDQTFVYLDPPYRPLSPTAYFTAYARHPFDDAQQLALADFYRMLARRGAALMLSNADPHNVNPHDDFFERAYAGFHIARVQARRAINSQAGKRGPISELLIMNY